MTCFANYNEKEQDCKDCKVSASCRRQQIINKHERVIDSL